MTDLRTRAAAVLLAGAVTIMPALAAGPDANAARAFVQKLYDRYPQANHKTIFEPTDKDAAGVFEPGMIAALRQDRQLAKGEVGFVDGDPICDCQDDDGMTSKIVSVTMSGPKGADVAVKLVFPGGLPIVQTLHLVVVSGQWRIQDISTPDTKSYRADLLKANKDAVAHHH